MRTPFSWLAERVSLSPRALRWATTASLVVSIVIVFTGGVVRVTGSGLGCPSWPACETGSLAPTPELGVHGVIEFANRVFTGVVILAVGWAIVAARLQRPRDRAVTRLAWSQFWLVVANAVAGGVTVLTELNPWVVALHFVMAIALLTTTTLTWHRTLRQAAVDEEPPPAARGLAVALMVVTLALVLAGTIVSGAGPHSGDSAAVPRIALDWTTVAIVHGALGGAVIVLAIALLVVLARTRGTRLARQRTIAFLVVLVLQAAVGTTQSLTGLPDLLVAIHLLGAALVWAGALRVLLDVHPRLFRAGTRADERVAHPTTAPAS